MTISNVTFETPLDTREEIEAVIKHGAKVEGILTKPFIISFTWNGERWRLTIPEGYEAAPSIPRLLRSFMPATGAIKWMGYPHDFGYEFHIMPRKDLDDLMAAGQKTGGDSWYVRNKAWLAVRTGGWVPWNKHEGENTLIGMERIDE